MRVVVTGASGYLGRHLVKRLRDYGFDVASIGLSAFGGSFLLGDLTSPSDVHSLVEQLGRADSVVHLAAQRTGKDIERVNALLAEGGVELAVRLRARRVIHMSSAGVYARDVSGLREAIDDDSRLGPKGPYERSKLRAEQVVDATCHRFGIEAVHLRPVSVFGDEPAHCLPKLRERVRRRRMILPNHSGFMNFVYVGDVAEVTAGFLSTTHIEHRSYLLSDPAPITEVVTELGSILGVDAPFMTVPDVLFDMAGRLGDLASILRLGSPMTSAVVAAIREPYLYNSNRLASRLPAWPPVGWRRGLQLCPL